MGFIEDRQKQLQRIKDINAKLKATSPEICGRCGTAAVILECTPAGYEKDPVITAVCNKCGITSEHYVAAYCYNKHTGRFEHRDVNTALQLALNEICRNTI